MPQIKLEYTNNITCNFDFSNLFKEVHQVLNQIAGMAMMNCKSRAVKLENYYIGDGQNNYSFVHLEIALLEGRKAEIKKEIGKTVLEILIKYFGGTGLQITIELKDIKRDFYFKHPEGTLSKL